jgi:hypothetical protein
MIVYQVTILDGSNNNPIVNANVKITASWNNKSNWLSFGGGAGSQTFTGTTDGNGQYQISLSNIGFGDAPYLISGSASAKGYFSTTWTAQINGNANGTTVNHTDYLVPNIEGIPPGTPFANFFDIFGGSNSPSKQAKSAISQGEQILIWIIALVIIIAVIILLFVLKGRFGAGESIKPKIGM